MNLTAKLPPTRAATHESCEPRVPKTFLWLLPEALALRDEFVVTCFDWSATVSVALLREMQARTLALQSPVGRNYSTVK